MRSFIGRDILSLKDWERAEFFRVYRNTEAISYRAEGRID